MVRFETFLHYQILAEVQKNFQNLYQSRREECTYQYLLFKIKELDNESFLFFCLRKFSLLMANLF